MKRLMLAVVLVVFCLAGVTACGSPATTIPAETGDQIQATSPFGSDADFARAFADRAAGLDIEGRGTVYRMLNDDTDGARHQRFIVRLDSGQTLLVTHNIDIAPRVSGLRVGDTVSFRGEYEWNAEGGVIHWTHHDPTGNHPAGWITHHGRTYQ